MRPTTSSSTSHLRRTITPRCNSTEDDRSTRASSSSHLSNVTFQASLTTTHGETLWLSLSSSPDPIPLGTSKELFPVHSVLRPVPLRTGIPVKYRYAVYSGGRFDRFVDEGRTVVIPVGERFVAVKDVISSEQSQTIVSPSPPQRHMDTPPHQMMPTIPGLMKPMALNASEGVLVVSLHLPCKLTRVRRGVWTVEMDESSLLYRQPNPTSSSVMDRMRARYVGVPPCDQPIPRDEQAHVTRALSKHGCVPVFLSEETRLKATDYCENTLRNVFYGFVDVYGRVPTKWWNPNLQNSNWYGYLEAGKLFAEVVQSLYDSRTIVWVHGYELIPLLPQLARKLHATTRRVGLSLHRPFPSSEIFRTLSVRVDLLRAILSADMISFHLFEYVRHFAACARRMLGLEEEKIFPGHVELNVDGRSVLLCPIHGGVDVPHMMRYLSTKAVAAETRVLLERERKGRIMIVGLDFGGALDGIKTKLLAFERLLEDDPSLAHKVCLIEHVVNGRWGGPGGGGVVNPSSTIDPTFDYSGLMEETDVEDDESLLGEKSLARVDSSRPVLKSPWNETKCRAIVERINVKFSQTVGNERLPVVKLHVLKEFPTTPQRLAWFAAADVLFQTPLREGISMLPFEFCLASAQTHGFYTGREGFDFSSDEEDEATDGHSTKKVVGLGIGFGGSETGGTGPTNHRDDREYPVTADGDSRSAMESSDGGGDHLLFADPDEVLGKLPPQPVPVMVLSEFSAHVAVLCGAIRVNPWRVDTVFHGLKQALNMGLEERIARFQADLETVKHRTATRWAEHVLTKIKLASALNAPKNAEPDVVVGMGLNIRLIRGDKVAKKLEMSTIIKACTQAKRRLLLLDYGGTTVMDDLGARFAFRPKGGVLYPTSEMLEVLLQLAKSSDTDTFIVSGRQREELEIAFEGALPYLGLVAEHGFYTKLPGETKWKHIFGDDDVQVREWMDTAVNLMQVYAMRTNGTYVEQKESMVLWQFRDADPDFGAKQAQELQLHLQFVLQPFNVDVVKGKGYVEVRTAGCDKGRAGRELFESKPDYDFILAMGDDQADEPMFEVVNLLQERANANGQEMKAFTCVVGVQSRSSAEYHVDEVGSVLELLQTLRRGLGQRNFGSVLDFAGIDTSEDEGRDFFDNNGAGISSPIGDDGLGFGNFGDEESFHEESCTYEELSFIPSTMRVSQSVPAFNVTFNPGAPDVYSSEDDDRESPLVVPKKMFLSRASSTGGRFDTTMDDRPPSF